MLYPIAIEQGDTHKAWGVVVPDLAGCFSAGDTLDEAVKNAKDAMEGWIEAMLDKGLNIPTPSNLGQLQRKSDYKGWIWALVDIDPSLLDDSSERINITIPRRVLLKVDRYVGCQGKTRSGFLVEAALRAMAPC